MALLSREGLRERIPSHPIVIAAQRAIEAHMKFGSVGVHSPLTAVATGQRPEGVVWSFLSTNSRKFLVPPLSHIQSTTSWVGFTSSVSLLIFLSPARTRPRSWLCLLTGLTTCSLAPSRSPPHSSPHLMVQFLCLDGAAVPLTQAGPEPLRLATGSSPSGPCFSPFPTVVCLGLGVNQTKFGKQG